MHEGVGEIKLDNPFFFDSLPRKKVGLARFFIFILFFFFFDWRVTRCGVSGHGPLMLDALEARQSNLPPPFINPLGK